MTTYDAAARIGTDASALVALADELLNRSGATAAILEFQQRANRIRESSENLLDGGAAAATTIADDIAFMRDVSNALDGARHWQPRCGGRCTDIRLD